MSNTDIAVWAMKGIGSCFYLGELNRVDLSTMTDAPVFVAKEHRHLVQGMSLILGTSMAIITPKEGVMYRVDRKQGTLHSRYYLIGIHPNNMEHFKNHVGMKGASSPEWIFTSRELPPI
ncbi:hypothetical protein Axy10_083 [Achromobacter phage vB_AxyP_19-32_Axy10]|uniref:Uncharacterized protein n=1 Tax=Achromobacter phage vB_AxyP_19-32_Axy10 TaxID=2591041 RepID=A0A514CU10_9CAUD|nr:hypothetical protein KMC59_gp35 [Achromobacter phage vB_AxyP_19-32_Axy10]QDH83962.1 hypothetical protein Axy10_083 [Achromobacter phage vB_AxyP_19-32_Axy10]